MNVLEKIIEQKKILLTNLKKKFTDSFISEEIKKNNTYLNFTDAIIKKNKKKKTCVIAEIKKASPSAGIIIKDYNPVDIGKIYNLNGATCLSILTEEKFFLGNLDDIKKVKKNVKLPVLCKDFFIDPYQVPLAKSFGADAILIILSGVDIQLAKELYQTAIEYDVTPIVEIHSTDEAEKSIDFKKALIGINNRNLKTLKTDIKTTFDLFKILSNHSMPIICESGIKNEEDIKRIISKTGILNFLIGESLLKDIEGSSFLKKITQISQ